MGTFCGSVGWHADQLTRQFRISTSSQTSLSGLKRRCSLFTDLGPYPTIVSLSLGTPRAFKLRPSADPNDPTLDILGRTMRNYEVVLPHNSILIMVSLFMLSRC